MKRMAAWFLATLAAAALLAGCGNAKPVPTPSAEKIEPGLTLRYWAPGWLGTMPAARTQALALFGKLEEATGVRIEIIHPATQYAGNQLVELQAIDAMPEVEQMGLPEPMAMLEKADAAWRAKPGALR